MSAQTVISTIQTTGALTAARTLSITGLPAGSRRFFANQCTGAFKVKIAPATGDFSTNGIANGFGAWGYYDGSNWNRMTPDVAP